MEGSNTLATATASSIPGPELKLVIVMRKDLNMRKGKMCSQAGHASVYAYQNGNPNDVEAWVESGQKKVVVGASSREELQALYQQALDAGVPAVRVDDFGHTEFHGIVTMTCIAIGPAYSHEIDPITGELSLL